MIPTLLDNKSAEAELANHSLEGITILAARPSRLFRAIIITQIGLLLAAIGWSFIGQADIIVRASGKLGPESQERLVYPPLDGQLANLYVTEGALVTADDVLARINSPAALTIAAQVTAAELKLKAAEATYDTFPLQKASIEHYVKTHQFQIETAERAQEQRLTEWLEKLAEEQRIKLDKARIKVESAQQAMKYARDDWQRHTRVFQSTGGGGIARSKVEEKRKEHLDKQAEYETARGELAEFEVKLKQDYDKKKKEVDTYSEQLLSLYAQLAERQASLASSESQALTQLEMARAELASFQRIAVEDIDAGNFVRIKAPVSGVVTSVSSTQTGAKLEQKEPFIGIAPANASTVLLMEIPERERALLKEGMTVKVKFNAFPYQRYGLIKGVLEYIAPSASYSAESTQQSRVLVFKARVSLERLHYTPPGESTEIPLRYGMTAIAEIVVRQRRLIDLALDPFRRAAG